MSRYTKLFFVFFHFVVSMIGCNRTRHSTSNTKDIATNVTANGSPSAAFLYYREGEVIVRVRCPDGLLAVNYDRLRCTEDKKSVPASLFIDLVSAGVGTTIDGHARNVQDLYAGIARLDNQLLQILAATPAIETQMADLQRELNEAEVKIAAFKLKITEIDLQINKIKADLALRNDTDLTMQLNALLIQRSEFLAKQTQAELDEQSKRQAFILANSTILNEDTFHDIQDLRKIYLQQLENERSLLATAMVEVSDLNKMITQLNHADFTYAIIEEQPAFPRLKPFARKFQESFATLRTAPDYVAPAFTPTQFAFSNPHSTITFSETLPPWAAQVSIEVNGKTVIVPAAKEIPLSLAVANLHAATETLTIKVQVLDRFGQKSQPSSIQNVTVVLGDYADMPRPSTALAQQLSRHISLLLSECVLADDGPHCAGEKGVSEVPELNHPQMISAGLDHACAIDDNGMSCWGELRHHQPSLPRATYVSAGQYNPCAIQDGTVYCWGYANDPAVYMDDRYALNLNQSVKSMVHGSAWFSRRL